MTRFAKMVWSEGMHLAQHHFQMQSTYFEGMIQFALSELFFEPYGLAGCELDGEALRNGTVALIHARGVMPDGLPFHIPDGDAAPAPLSIGDLFSPVQDSHLVLLTIPAYKSGSRNYADSTNGGGTSARYLAESRMIADETTGQDERSVTVARKNFSLRLDIDVSDEFVSLPLACVRRDGTGSFVYDPEFVPPCLQIGASRRVMELLDRLIEMLIAKRDALAQERQTGRASSGSYTGREVASFWVLHAINSSIAPLRYHRQVRHSRPEQLYLELARLAGALCTFRIDSHPDAIPPYDHRHLAECFTGLDQHIRAHLEVVIPTNCVPIPLERDAAYLYAGTVTDQRCFGRARWILGVHSSAGEAETIARVPQLVKVCSRKFTAELVRRAHSGLRLDHLSMPPAAISPRADTQYFVISRTGPCWDTLVQTGEVGVYVPDALPNAEIEMLVVIDD